MAPKNRHRFLPEEKRRAVEELRKLLVVLEDERRLFLSRIRRLDKEIDWVEQRLALAQAGSKEPDEGGSQDVST